MAGHAEFQLLVQVPVDRYWAAMKESNKLIPLIDSEVVASVQTIQGEDGVVGAIRLIEYGSAPAVGYYVKDKLVAVDEAAYEVTTAEIEGGHLIAGYSEFKQTIKLTSTDDRTTNVKWSLEYKTEREPEHSLEEIKAACTKVFKTLESYLLANNAYA